MEIINRIIPETECEFDYTKEFYQVALSIKLLICVFGLILSYVWFTINDISCRLNKNEKKINILNSNVNCSNSEILLETQLFKTAFYNKINNLKQVLTNEIRKKLNIKKIHLDMHQLQYYVPNYTMDDDTTPENTEDDVENNNNVDDCIENNNIEKEEEHSSDEFENDKTSYEVINDSETNYKILFENRTEDEFKKMFYDKISELMKEHEDKQIMKHTFKISNSIDNIENYSVTIGIDNMDSTYYYKLWSNFDNILINKTLYSYDDIKSSIFNDKELINDCTINESMTKIVDKMVGYFVTVMVYYYDKK